MKSDRATFTADDLTDLPGLAAKLKRPDGPVSQYIGTRLPKDTRDALANYTGEGDDLALRDLLVRDLNEIISGPSIFEKQRFFAIDLGWEAEKLLGLDPSGMDLRRLNRLLLEAAYPLVLVLKQAS